LFKVLRGFLFGIAFYSLRDLIFPKRRGWLTLWLVLLIVGIFSPFSSAPGSIEGVVYSTLPMWFHLMSLPELIIQSFLLAFLTHYWVNHPEKRWLKIFLGILSALIIVLALLGILSALGFLPAPE
jgi:phosphotransferase system  glucose/maltose/N-acetylglucosamine-specific IIC component